MMMDQNRREDLARMKGLSFAIAVAIVGLLLTAFIWVEACSGQEISSEYVVPVVARNPGAAGTAWRTSLCITNPQWYPLNVHVELWQSGAMVGQVVNVRNGGTLCGDDFILDWFGFKRHQDALILRSTLEDNPNLEFVQFVPSVRVYNDAPEGTFGVGVYPVPIFGPLDPRGRVYAWEQASGVLHWGEPEEDGFRAAWGVFNASSSSRTINVYVREHNGNLAHEERVEVPGRTQIQHPMPKSVELDRGGSITIQYGDLPQDDPPAYGYVTVVDNRTGDGYYQPMREVHEWQIGDE